MKRQVQSDLKKRFNAPGAVSGVSMDMVQSSIVLPDSVLIPSKYDFELLNKSINSDDLHNIANENLAD